ncbi:MAG: FadR family transcriptional regulator [Labilithrix sp.]|nr:FadR family transcriptional regulator [Labilithrix sp.]MBX3222240.1 FadR family transcriptional regulator [Labilithrix sp.]
MARRSGHAKLGSEPPRSERPTDRPEPPSSERGEPPVSQAAPPVSQRGAARGEDGRARHAADPIHDKLALAILDGTLAPGSSLPPERELAERFGVSRLIVRQALHRLADVGLVRVRQGGPSLVVHPNEAKDLRVIDLIYRLGQGGAREVRELIERQFLHGYALLFLAAKRASKERLRALAEMAEDYAARGAPVAEMLAFEKRFFQALGEATDNRFYQLETSWWFHMVEGRGERPAVFTDEQRQAFYREIARRLVEDKDAARFYLDTLSPILDMVGSFSLGR